MISMLLKWKGSKAAVVHTFNPCTPAVEKQVQVDLCEFEATLVYKR